MYFPDLTLAKEIIKSPIAQADEQFFIENDMIVFDHQAKTIWSGGGGSWPQRMVDFGTTGDHCGICFEDDPRKENLDPRQISDWFVASPPPEISVYKAE